MDAYQVTPFMLGEINVSPSHNMLAARSATLKLQPKAMAVLCYLASNQSRVISTEELIERLWEGRVVTHGSVQKSINTLRSAFSELIGDQDLIAHYSKRGYQLKLEPQFLAAPSPDVPPLMTVTETPITLVKKSPWFARVVWALALLLAMAAVYKGLNWRALALPKHHKTEFHSTQGYTNETGHERSATPHPDNLHVAYIREKLNTEHLGETESDIVIRNGAGRDWRIANSQGSWFKLAWSPAGNNLVAVEVKRRDGLPLGTQFYEKPNYLYSFHIFVLDLEHERLLEKQQLSQWQGRIFSVTWWDENTLEIVAKQGPNSGNGRYRYSVLDQQLKLLDELEGATNPIASSVLKQTTALASLHKNKVQIDFLNPQQTSLGRAQLDFASVDISWIPDGSGILVYAEEERKLLAVYLDGQQVQIPLADTKDKVFSRPRYSADGNGIFYTEEKRSSNILLAALSGIKTRLTENTDFNYAASFSPKGDKVVYASVRNNQIHLWLVEAGQERQITTQPIPKKVGAIIWSEDGEHLIFSAGTQLYHHNLVTSGTDLVLNGSDKIEPVAYFPNTNRLLAVKNSGEVRNLWRIEGQQQKQLTFGSVGSAVEYGGDVLFQYVGEKGLWALRSKDDTLEQVTPSLGEYSKLLKADAKGIYFMSGGVCHESDIYYWDYASAAKSTFLVRENKLTSTTSFNANKGILHTECYLPEANIVLLK